MTAFNEMTGRAMGQDKQAKPDAKRSRGVPVNTGKKRDRPATQTAKKQRAGGKALVGEDTQSETPTRRDPTEAEVKAIEAAKADHKQRPARIAYERDDCSGGKVLGLQSPHSDGQGQTYLAMDSLGSRSDDFVNEGIKHIANMTTSGGEAHLPGLNAGLALMAAIDPQDELEAALALQMASVHESALDLLRRSMAAQTREGMRDYANLATKMTRTFTAQLKALGEMRRGGEQVVRHFHVYQFGPGVVAENINVGGQQNAIGNEQAHGSGFPVFGPHAFGSAMPSSQSTGEGQMLHARGSAGVGSAEGKSQCVETRGAVRGPSPANADAAGAASGSDGGAA